MTVQKLYVKNKYFGDGANTVFPITFEWAKKHPESIQVWVRNNAGVLTKTDNFLLKTSSNEDIWNVVYPSVGDPLGQGETITIVRELSLLQVLNLVNQGPFFAEDVEITFDELVMMIQQLNEKLARSFKVAVDIDGENTFDTTVPIEPGKSLRVKDDGTGFEVTEDPAQVLPLAKSELEAVKREHAEAVQDLTVIKDEVESAKTDAQNAANRAEQAASTSAQEAVENAQAQLDQYLTNANQAKTDAQNAADEASKDAQKAENAVATLPNNWQDIVKKTDGFVTPEMFKDYDGDDWSLAIQRAVNTHKPIIFTGTYGIGETVNVHDYCNFIGGNFEHITPGLAYMFFIDGVEKPILRDMHFDSKLVGRGSICLNECRYALVENCTFTGYTLEHGYYRTDSQLMDSNCYRTRIDGCNFYDNGYGYGAATETLNRCITTQDGDNPIIIGCTFKRVNQCIGTNSLKPMIVNCKFYDWEDNAIYAFNYGHISDCVFKNSSDEGIVLLGGDFEISDCVFEEIGNKAIAITGNTNSLTINNCKLKTNEDNFRLIEFRNPRYTLEKLIVSNCDIIAYAPFDGDVYKCMFAIGDCAYTHIYNNRIKQVTYRSDATFVVRMTNNRDNSVFIFDDNYIDGSLLKPLNSYASATIKEYYKNNIYNQSVNSTDTQAEYNLKDKINSVLNNNIEYAYMYDNSTLTRWVIKANSGANGIGRYIQLLINLSDYFGKANITTEKSATDITNTYNLQIKNGYIQTTVAIPANTTVIWDFTFYK